MEEVDRGGGNVAGKVWGVQQGREGEQVAGLALTPRRPASNLELKSGGRSRQRGLKMGGLG